LGTGHALLGGKLCLLLSVCNLCCSLGLALLPVPLVDGLRNCVPTEPLFHLRPLALSSVDGTDEAGLGLRRSLTAGKGNQGAACDPRDMLLLSRRER
jgi:hypothetical protein